MPIKDIIVTLAITVVIALVLHLSQYRSWLDHADLWVFNFGFSIAPALLVSLARLSIGPALGLSQGRQLGWFALAVVALQLMACGVYASTQSGAGAFYAWFLILPSLLGTMVYVIVCLIYSPVLRLFTKP